MRARPSSGLPTSLGLLTLALGCASSAPPKARPEDVTMVRHVDRATDGVAIPPAILAGARCRAGACTCRAEGDDAETDPPAEGQKRLELRLSADAGEGALESPSLGRFAVSGARETCFYVDVVAGSAHQISYVSKAADESEGVTPRLLISEYGPVGPHWYKVLGVECVGAGGRCDRAGADAWSQTLTTRKRGRLDPCGSMVVTGLAWETTGGEATRDGGRYRDFVVRFQLEAKKFTPKFAPGSPECVPK